VPTPRRRGRSPPDMRCSKSLGNSGTSPIARQSFQLLIAWQIPSGRALLTKPKELQLPESFQFPVRSGVRVRPWCPGRCRRAPRLLRRDDRPGPSSCQPPQYAEADGWLMVANGDGGKPVWLTEFGWYADPNPSDPVPAPERHTCGAGQTHPELHRISGAYSSVHHTRVHLQWSRRGRRHRTGRLLRGPPRLQPAAEARLLVHRPTMRLLTNHTVGSQALESEGVVQPPLVLAFAFGRLESHMEGQPSLAGRRRGHRDLARAARGT